LVSCIKNVITNLKVPYVPTPSFTASGPSDTHATSANRRILTMCTFARGSRPIETSTIPYSPSLAALPMVSGLLGTSNTAIVDSASAHIPETTLSTTLNPLPWILFGNRQLNYWRLGSRA
jgi:hypothetical protein